MIKHIRKRLHPPLLIVTLVFLLVFCGTTVSASDIGGIILPDYHHIDITLAHNAGTNYIKFDGGGINALHISTSTSEPYGQVTTTQSESGTFFISDTGGRGFFDDLILMVAVKDDVPDDYAVHVRASGYRWTPTPVLNMPPARGDVMYISSSIDETFTKQDFIYGPQPWRPYNGPDYPFYCGQDMQSSDETFRFMFIDLRIGALGPNSLLEGLTDNGFAKIEYDIQGDATFTTFNIYGWCNQSNQGKGISWTNDVSGGSNSGTSGFSVLAPGTPASGGDQPTSWEFTNEVTGEGSGYDGSVLAQGEPVAINGNVWISHSDDPAATLDGQKTAEFHFDGTSYPSGNQQNGYLYVYAADGKNTATGNTVLPDLDFGLDGKSLDLLQSYQDGGVQDGTISATYVFNLPVGTTAGPHILSVMNRNTGTKITIQGGMMLVFPDDGSSEENLITFTEGVDMIRADPGKSEEEVTTPSLFRDVPVPERRPDRALVYLVSTGTSPESPSPLRFYFNKEHVNVTSSDTESPVEVRTFDVTGIVRPAGNSFSVAVIPVNETERSQTENRNAILIFTYHPEKTVETLTPITTTQPIETKETIPPTISQPSVSTTSPIQKQIEEPDDSGSISSILPGPIRNLVDWIFGVLFAVTGSEEPTNAVTVPQSPGSTVIPGQIDIAENSPENSTNSPLAKETQTIADESPVSDPVSSGNGSDDAWVTGPAISTSPYGGLYITSVPEGADITIDGKLLGMVTPRVIFGLREGSHTVRISNEKGLFAVTEHPAWVYRGLLSMVSFDLSPGMKKTIEIRSDLYAGDQFTVNGKYPVYRIPSKITQDKSGSYLTILHDSSYVSRDISDFMNPGGTMEIGSTPVKLAGVQVTSNPAGADVLVDGFITGQKTPCIVENLSEGRHTIAVSMLGYEPVEEMISIMDDPSREVDADVAFTLPPYTYGELSVKSTPPGATVLVNTMNFRQTAPCTFPYLTIGSYSMKVNLGDKVRIVEFDIVPEKGLGYDFDFVNDTFNRWEYRLD